MTETTKPEIIEVTVPGSREKFETWIKERGGVRVWDNINLSDWRAGPIFTPAQTDGKPTDPPHWGRRQGELITDIARFRFVKTMKEIRRFRVAVRMGSQGFSLKCTDASSDKVIRECTRVQELTVRSPCYYFHYETQECVIEVPVFDGEADTLFDDKIAQLALKYKKK